ncbi:MAG TPA: hypothetical protein VJN64_15950 [Terriglobales bacterium]|nr:hypothetical protein [Terriglobales bacterium]
MPDIRNATNTGIFTVDSRDTAGPSLPATFAESSANSAILELAWAAGSLVTYVPTSLMVVPID